MFFSGTVYDDCRYSALVMLWTALSLSITSQLSEYDSNSRSPTVRLRLDFTMRAFVIKEHAHPSEIQLTNDASEPTPGPNQVLVDVYSAGLNFYDVSLNKTDIIYKRRNIFIS